MIIFMIMVTQARIDDLTEVSRVTKRTHTHKLSIQAIHLTTRSTSTIVVVLVDVVCHVFVVEVVVVVAYDVENGAFAFILAKSSL